MGKKSIIDAILHGKDSGRGARSTNHHPKNKFSEPKPPKKRHSRIIEACHCLDDPKNTYQNNLEREPIETFPAILVYEMPTDDCSEDNSQERC
jgi:hypothetical protein